MPLSEHKLVLFDFATQSWTDLTTTIIAPVCDSAELPRVSWHSFRHGNARLLGARRVHKDCPDNSGTLRYRNNAYMHAIPDSQRRAVDRVAGVLFPDVPKFLNWPRLARAQE